MAPRLAPTVNAQPETVTEALAAFARARPWPAEVEAAFGNPQPGCPPAVWRLLVVAGDLARALADDGDGVFDFAVWASAAFEAAE